MLLTNNLEKSCDGPGIHRCLQRGNGAVYSLQLERQGRQWCCEEECRAFLNVMKDAPVDFPDEELSPAEFQGTANHIGKR